MQNYQPALVALVFILVGCRSNPYNQRLSEFLQTTNPKMSAWLDEEVDIDPRNIAVPLGRVDVDGWAANARRREKKVDLNLSRTKVDPQKRSMRNYLSLWMLRMIPGLGFERQPIILRGRAAQGAAIKVKNESLTRRELLHRFHKEHGIVMDLVVVEGRICIRCRSREYIEIVERSKFPYR